jgi:hypothetical protein
MEEKTPTKKKMALWKKLSIAFVITIILFEISQSLEKSPGASKRPQSKLTMAYVVARRTLKEGLKDPDSYQEIGHKEYYDAGADSAKNNMQVIIQYRAKNSFGGFVVEKKAFNFDSTGIIVDSYATK